MAGPYRVLLSRATVVEEGGAGRAWKGVTFSIRDGVATIKERGSLEVMTVGEPEHLGRNHWRVTGTHPNATTWTITRPCGCRGG